MKTESAGLALPDNTVLEGGRRGAARFIWLDALRGAAVLGMVTYHTAWDLSQLALIETDIVASPGWSGFARFVAAIFLVLVGVGVVLATRSGFKPRPFGRRFGMLVVASAAITVVTYLVFPDSFIFFGVLHNIALSSLIALPFARARAGLAAGAAIALWVAPLLRWPTLFDAPWLYWVGLGLFLPETNDWVPVFPWTGFALAGVAAAKLAPAYMPRLPLPASAPGLATIAAIGRRSLLIYVVHQPIIFGALYGLREITGPNPAAEAAPFTRQCVASCQLSGGSAPICTKSCACTVERLKREGLWKIVLSGQIDEEERIGASRIAQACLRETRE